MAREDEWGKLLVKHGFISKGAKARYRKTDKGIWEPMKGKEIDPKDADMEIAEEVNIQAVLDPKFSAYLPTGYPDPHKRYVLVVEDRASKISMEETYYWLTNYMKDMSSYPYFEKIIDVFSASEQSAAWGAAQQRMGLQQDRASQYFKGMSEMIKQLFQLVRELRVLDEKMEPRKQWGKVKAADVALKGEYTDLVENRGGQVQPGSIYHLAQTVGFTTLPDLFFNTHIYSLDDIDGTVDALKFNKSVKSVLRRKLFAFVNWKLRTDKELENRRVFTLKYLRQHWNVIKMYMNWVKPYLRNIARMQMSQEHIDSHHIVSAFETSMTEIELLVHKPSPKGAYHPTIIATFKYRTRPELSFQKDQYAHKGPVHHGRAEVHLRGYAWTKEQIEAYKNYKKDEDMMLLGMVDHSVKDAMDALGEELENYLWEAGEKQFEQKRKEKEFLEKKKKRQIEQSLGLGMLDPFLSIFRGIGEILTLFIPSGGGGKKKSKAKGSPAAAKKSVATELYMMFKNYKKGHGMISW